ncbi:hypothetical protein BHE74_00014008 [Ensete ventricosum]|nr:hypothetical protein BHE74_00014008 [Ensete ventricosum]
MLSSEDPNLVGSHHYGCACRRIAATTRPAFTAFGLGLYHHGEHRSQTNRVSGVPNAPTNNKSNPTYRDAEVCHLVRVQGRPELGAMTFDEVSLERSKGFVQALQVSPAPPLNPDL